MKDLEKRLAIAKKMALKDKSYKGRVEVIEKMIKKEKNASSEDSEWRDTIIQSKNIFRMLKQKHKNNITDMKNDLEVILKQNKTKENQGEIVRDEFNKYFKIPKETKNNDNTDVSELKNRITNYVTENSDKKIKTINERVKDSDLQKFKELGIHDNIVMAFYCGVRSIANFKGEVEMSELEGLFSMRDDVIQEQIDTAIDNCKNGAFEIGLKYPSFDLKKIINKYNINKSKIIKKRGKDFRNEYQNYIYEIFIGEHIVFGHQIGRDRYQDSKLFEEVRDGNEIGDVSKFTALDGGYFGLVSSNQDVILDIIKEFASQQNSYVKEIDILINGLGGVDHKDLDVNKIKYEHGGEVETIKGKYPNVHKVQKQYSSDRVEILDTDYNLLSKINKELYGGKGNINKYGNLESMYSLSEPYNKMADGGSVSDNKKTWIVNIAMPTDDNNMPKLRKEEIVLGRLSNEFDVQQAILRKGNDWLRNGRVLSVYEKKAKGGKVSSNDYYTSVNHWVYFTLNYPSNFMDAFKSLPTHIKTHLEGKFKTYYDDYGTYGVMNKFWVELDGENRELLANWVKYNYTGETAPKISDKEYQKIINHWVYFTLNYPQNFMDAFGDKQLKTHLEGKFKTYYDSYGTYSVMDKFFVELSSGNRESLTNWAKDNYTGTKMADGGEVVQELGDLTDMYAYGGSVEDKPTEFKKGDIVWDSTNKDYGVV